MWHSVQFSHSVVSDSLQPHRLQYARLPCSLPSLWVYPSSCPLNQWCHPTSEMPSHPLLPSSPLAFYLSQHQGLFQWVSSLCQVAKVLERQHQTSNEYSGLISFRIDWFDLLAVQGTQESSPAPQFENINSSAFNLLCVWSSSHICTWLLEKE